MEVFIYGVFAYMFLIAICQYFIYEQVTRRNELVELLVNKAVQEEARDPKLITKLLNYVEDDEREDYLSSYGEESNNYLMLDSDLDLHVEQEPNEHIYQVIHKLNKLHNKL
jgi:hypothetical protein